MTIYLRDNDTEERQINPLCLGCQHLNRACSGTHNPVYGGCILKDQEPEKAAEYIAHMTEKIEKGARL